jgi:hypothetical protein
MSARGEAVTSLAAMALGCVVGAGCSSGPAGDCASNAMCIPADATTEGDAEGGALGEAEGGVLADAGDSETGVSADATMSDARTDAPGDAPNEAPSDAPTDAPRDGFVCDSTKAPHDEACVVANAYGVFVSASGSDTAAGTMADPLRTITAGIAKAGQTGKGRVYLCEGNYAEQVALSSPVNLYGALACDAGWTYVDGGSAQVTGAANQIVLTISGVSTPIAVEDLGVTAANASGQDDAGNGLSSLAALVNASTVTFRRCAFSGGNGADGADGVIGSNYSAVMAPNGSANDGGVAGVGASIACADGTSSWGGNGGNGAATIGAAGGDGGAMPMPTVASPGFDGVGGSGGTTNCGAGGDPGASGMAGDGGNAATDGNYGALTAGSWTPTSGGTGSNGNPGQGGGGGSGKSTPTLGGTGGGSGGCGGAGGPGGHGGGGSIALACIGSTVTIEACVFRAAAGGNGGKGGDGQPGQGGGAPGTPTPAVGPCAGAYGGNGGGGGAGAGGTGGVSVCIVYRGSAPSGLPICAMGDAGAPGIGGLGGEGGSNLLGIGQPGGAGSIGTGGVVQAILQAP